MWVKWRETLISKFILNVQFNRWKYSENIFIIVICGTLGWQWCGKNHIHWSVRLLFGVPETDFHPISIWRQLKEGLFSPVAGTTCVLNFVSAACGPWHWNNWVLDKDLFFMFLEGGRERGLGNLLIARVFGVFGIILLQLWGTGCRLQICIQIQLSGLPELEVKRRWGEAVDLASET